MKPENTIVPAATGVPVVRSSRGLWLGHEPLSAPSTDRPAGWIDPEVTGE